MDEYLKQFLYIIRNGSVDNTYKMAWGKAIVEISLENPNIERIELSHIATKMFKYYWNQTIYFDLIQGSNLSKPPEFVSIVKKEVEKYFWKKETKQPIMFDRVEEDVFLDLSKLVRILKQDVSWRFLKVKGEVFSIYEYEKGNDYLIVNNPKLISEYSDVIFESINFRWTQILENYNSSPRIAKKVRNIDLEKIKRGDLSKFRPFIDIENPEYICSICGEKILNETPSVDHVIPWSFMFSDDLWNLVYTHKSCNSQKNNIIPSESDIIELETRNIRLMNALDVSCSLKSKKPSKELKMAIEKDFVRKFWINCKS